jgi:hypothetical protein
MLTLNADLSPVRRGRSLSGASLAQDTTPSQSTKRQLDAAFTNDPSPTKRARLTQTDTQRGKHPTIATKGVEHNTVAVTGPSRRSARLKTRQPSTSGEDPACLVQLSPLREPEAEASTRENSLPSERASPQTYTQQQPGVQNKEIVEVGTVFIHVKSSANTVQKPKPPSITIPEAEAGTQEQFAPDTFIQEREIDSDGNNDHLLERAQLTRKNLAKFNRMGKKGASKALASAPLGSVTESSLTKTTSTTTTGFAMRAHGNGVLLHVSSKPPTNLRDFHQRYDRSRGTASPTESEHKRYIHTVEDAGNEATMVFEVGKELLKDSDNTGYKRAFNRAFTGFPKDVGFNNGLSAPQPDFVEGLVMEEYDPFPVQQYVDGAVLYKDEPRSVTIPHLAGEWKGPDGNLKEAELQSAYTGAALVFARNQALSYLGKSDPPGHAEVTTFTTDGTNLNLYAHYATTEDSTLKYHQYRYRSANLLNTHQEHKQGRRGLRNEQDHAYQQSCALRDQLKALWQQQQSRPLQAIAQGAPHPGGTLSETNAAKAGYVVVDQPCEPTPAESSSISLSKPAPPVDDQVSCSSGHKRKASLSQEPSRELSRPRSKVQEYWKWDAESGNYFHRHSNGKVTWLESSDEEN